MVFRSLRPLLVAISIVTVLHASPRATWARPFADAREAWRRGDYVVALNAFIQLLNGPDGEHVVGAIAGATGERYVTVEVTADGRAPRFSPDGRFIAYETGLETSRRTRIVRNDAARPIVADLPGVSATFNRDSSKVAYLRVGETAEVLRAAQDLESASLAAENRTQLVDMLAWLVARDSTVVVRDLAAGFDAELRTPPVVKSGLTFAADGETLYFLGGSDRDPSRTDIYRVSERSPEATLLVDAGGLKNNPIVDPSGETLLYTIPKQNPLARPSADARGFQPGVTIRSPETFAVVDLKTHVVSLFAGWAPALSGDGRLLAYVSRAGIEYSLMIGETVGVQSPVLRTLSPIDAPALSRDGTHVAWQMMPREDWEIFTADLAGTALVRERRLTRDIEHDLHPRFLDDAHLFALVGEARHRRARLFDLADASSEPTRLFHNNTVRTIAPEYDWAAAADGRQLLVVADREGDTVSPQRGVYLVDLRRPVGRDELLRRLQTNLRSETALRATAAHAFGPVTADARSVVRRVSTERIFSYEKALADCDSRHISKPGNARAAQWLVSILESFGYEAERQPVDSGAGREATDGQGGEQSAATADAQSASPNIVATLRGSVSPDVVYVIGSHYDSIADGPGADDNGSGTAAMIEAARVLAGHPLPATVTFVSFTGEESGLIGSRAFVRRAVASHTRIAGVLNNDMVGWTNDERLDNTIRYSNAGIRDVQHGAAILFTRLITYDARYWKGTDAASFVDAYGEVGGGIGSYPVLGSPYYHQAGDVLEHENHQLIAETTKATVASIVLLASSPSPVTGLHIENRSAAGVAVAWNPSLEKDVTGYVVTFGPASDPSRDRVTLINKPRATLPPLPADSIVSVKAVNARGLEGWDWSRVQVR